MPRKEQGAKDPGTPAMRRPVDIRPHGMARTVAWARNLARSLRHGLPFNARLLAFHGLEVPVPMKPILAARRLYEEAVERAPHRDNQGFRSANLAFYVRRPGGWGSDIRWISCDDTDTYERFRAVFDALGVAERMRERIGHDRTIRIYGAFFVPRSRCETPYLLDRACVYTYRPGRAIIFGGGFRHATAPMLDAEPRAFLCFTFGSDQPRHWPTITGRWRGKAA
jgi:hypothetical protein